MKKANRSGKIFLAVIALCLAAVTFINWGIFTNWGSITVKRLSVAGDDGVTYSSTIFIPENASNDTPAPAVINNHGNTSTSVSLISYAIEESRRGYVVILPDLAGRGGSELAAANTNGNNITVWIDYLLTAPFVDTDHLNISGFSMSGAMAGPAALPYIEHFDAVISWSNGGGNAITADVPVNFLAIRGTDDDLTRFNEKGEIVEMLSFAELAGIEDFQPNTLYGNFADKTARMYYRVPDMMHIAGSFDKTSVSVGMDFLMSSSPAPNPIDSADLVFRAKDWAGLAAMVLVVLFMLAVMGVFVDSPVFESIRQPMPKNVGLRKVGWGISCAVGLVVPGLLFVPLTGKQANLFPVSGTYPFSLTNGLLCWLGGLLIVSAAMGCLFHFTDGKRNGASLANYGLTREGRKTLDWPLIGKSFLLAVVIVFIGVYVINAVNRFLGTEYCFWFLDFSSLTPGRIVSVLPYMPLYFCSFLMSGFGMNVERRLPDSGNEKKDLILASVVNMLINALGIFVIVVVNVISAHNSPVNKQAIGGGLYALLAWGMVFGMLYTALITTVCYRKTGTLWLGAFINGMFMPLMLCNGVPYGVAKTGEPAPALAVGPMWLLFIVAIVVLAAAAVRFSKKAAETHSV